MAPGNFPERLIISTPIQLRAQGVTLDADAESAGKYLVTVTPQGEGTLIFGLGIDGGLTSGGLDAQANIEIHTVDISNTRELPAVNVTGGLRARNLVVDNGSTDDPTFGSLLTVGAGTTVEIEGCTLSRGSGGSTALAMAVLNDGGLLRASNCTLSQSGDSAAARVSAAFKRCMGQDIAV